MKKKKTPNNKTPKNKMPKNKTPNATKRPIQQNVQLQNTQCYKRPNATKGPTSKKHPKFRKTLKIIKWLSTAAS